jgi:IS5 family transposase
MSQQPSFASLAYQEKKKVTRRETFFNEMEQCVPWQALEALVEPKYPKAGLGRRPMPLGMMLRIHVMQQWFNLSDPAMEEALYDSDSMRRFAGIELGQDAIPDETTILNFRHLLEGEPPPEEASAAETPVQEQSPHKQADSEPSLSQQIFTQIEGGLEALGFIVRKGTIMDATIIAAPSSTKNKDKARDAEMTSTKKGNQWHFGMKAHIGADTANGLVHTVVCTTASEHDSQKRDELLHGDEKEIYGDKAYADETFREACRSRGIAYRINIKAKRGTELNQRDKSWNDSRSKVRALVEHPFGVVKNLWGHRKVRYRGIHKNAAQFFILFALANIYLVRKQLLKLAAA